MLQDIAPYVYHNEYTPCAPQPEDYLLIYREQELLLRQEETSFSLPKIKELGWPTERLHISCRYLFSISQKHFFSGFGHHRLFFIRLQFSSNPCSAQRPPCSPSFRRHHWNATFPLVRHTPLLRPLRLSHEAQRQRTHGLLP